MVAGVHARRVIFIDLVRAIAVVFMLYGHTVDALLAPQFRQGLVYDAWQFQRGLTSCLFLLLSGFAFSIATVRHWATQLTFSAALARRARRFALFIGLGYLLHVPLAPIWRMATAGEAQWRAMLSVDVLHVIGVSFIGIQLLVMVTRSPRRFTAAALILAVALVIATPASWSTDWVSRLPLALASYFTPVTGSLFPILPWSAFILLGAALGQLYAHRGAANIGRYANAVLLAPGVALLLLAMWLTEQQQALFGTGPFSFVPGDMAMRAGACLLVLGAVAHLTRGVTRLPHVFGAVAQESLIIYVVHLSLVYGSIWNPGLARFFGHRLAPLQLLPIVVSLIALMTLLAWQWNAWKHAKPALVRGIATGVGGLLLLRLLL